MEGFANFTLQRRARKAHMKALKPFVNVKQALKETSVKKKLLLKVGENDS